MIFQIEICKLQHLFSKSLAYFYFANNRFSFRFVSQITARPLDCFQFLDNGQNKFVSMDLFYFVLRHI